MAYLVHHMLSEAAKADPNREAARCRGRSITYRELDTTASSLATALSGAGVAVGERVAIHVPKDLEMLAAVFGAVRAGAAYVPIDPLAPEERVAAIVDDCAPAAVVTTTSRLDALLGASSHAPALAVLLDDGPLPGDTSCRLLTWEEACSSGTQDPAIPMVDCDLASVMFTSGSTGRPKGVMLSHRSLLEWARATRAVTEASVDDRLSTLAPLHFSMSTFEILQTVLARATLVMIPEEEAFLGQALERVLRQEGITIFTGTPSTLRGIMRSTSESGRFPALRQVWFGGESLHPAELRELRRWLPGTDLFHMYGGTETMGRSCWRVEDLPAQTERLPLGSPFDNVQLIVLKEDGTQASGGEEGELLVRGPMLMSGYWKDPVKTSETLVPNPLAPHLGDLVCRTGDRVRVGAGGLEFVGRLDDQVKSRGIRIELGDIDAAAITHPGVLEAVAVAVPHEVFGNVVALCVVPDQSSPPTEMGLRGFLAERLPLAMVPSHVAFVDEIPKTSTGKADRVRLRESVAEGLSSG